MMNEQNGYAWRDTTANLRKAVSALMGAGMVILCGSGNVRGELVARKLTHVPAGHVIQDENAPFEWTLEAFEKGTNDILIVGFGWESDRSLSSVTYNGQNMTLCRRPDRFN